MNFSKKILIVSLLAISLGFGSLVLAAEHTATPEPTMLEDTAMVEDAAEAYGKFLDALGCDWRNDPNSADTPRRVAKAYVFGQMS